MRLGSERLGALVRERMRREPRALFVFVGKRGRSMKALTWDGTGTIVVHKKLDADPPHPSRESVHDLLCAHHDPPCALSPPSPSSAARPSGGRHGNRDSESCVERPFRATFVPRNW